MTKPTDQTKTTEPTRGERIRAERLALGLTQTDLAKQLGLVQPQISQVENDKAPRILALYVEAKVTAMTDRVRVRPCVRRTDER